MEEKAKYTGKQRVAGKAVPGQKSPK